MKYITAALLASLLCLAPASLYAQKKPDSDRFQFHIGILSGATAIGGKIKGNREATLELLRAQPFLTSEVISNERLSAGNSREGVPLVGGILGWRYNTNPNIALGADFYVGWTDTIFLKYKPHSGPLFSLDPINRPFLDTFIYDLKTAWNLRLYWDLPIQGKPLSLFLLTGYQFRRVLITTETNIFTDIFRPRVERKTRSEIEHGYQVGFGSDYALVPAQPNIKLRLEYLFAQNFGKDSRELSTHDIIVGAIYYF